MKQLSEKDMHMLESERIKKANELIRQCYASTPDSYFGVCPRGLTSGLGCGGGSYECDGCIAKEEWEKVLNEYEKVILEQWHNPEKALSEALWLTHQFYDVPTRYMANGEEEEWCRQYAPERYKQGLERQIVLMRGTVTQTTIDQSGISEQKQSDCEQMTIFDFIQSGR